MDQIRAHLELAIHGTVTRMSDGSFDHTSLGYGVDAGPLLWAFSNERDRITQLPRDEADGKIELRTIRPHEWEFIVEVIITGIGAGAGIFCAAALNEVGKEVGKWAVKQLGLGDGSSSPIVTAGDQKTIIPRNDPASAEADLVKLINAAGKNNIKVNITLDPQTS